MDKKLNINPERARGFLMAIMKEWDRQGLLIQHIRVKRDTQDGIKNVLMTYDEIKEDGHE